MAFDERRRAVDREDVVSQVRNGGVYQIAAVIIEASSPNMWRDCGPSQRDEEARPREMMLGVLARFDWSQQNIIATSEATSVALRNVRL